MLTREPAGGGTHVTSEEEAVGGIAGAIPGAGLAADGRNVFSLRRLKELAEGGQPSRCASQSAP